MKTIKYLTILILSLFMMSCWCDKPKGPYYKLPFSVQYADSRIEMELPIVEKRFYAFNLDFMFKERDEAERAKVEKLVGSFRRDYNNKPTDTGIPIFLKLKIVRIDTQKQIIILDKKIYELPLKAYGNNSFDKEIAEIMLDKGRYRVSIESLKNISELNGIDICFSITYAYVGK